MECTSLYINNKMLNIYNDEPLLLPSTPVARNLQLRPLESTSTPACDKPMEQKRPRRRWQLRQELETLREPGESPISVFQHHHHHHQQQNQHQSSFDMAAVPLFGRRSTSQCRFSETLIASSTETMELLSNNNDSSTHDENDKLRYFNEDDVIEEEPEVNTSSFQEHEQLRKQLKCKNLTTPKHKSPKICKVDARKNTVSGKMKTTFDTTKHPVKSPKNGNLPTYKIPRKSPKILKSTNKSPKSKTARVVKPSPKKAQCNALKITKCPKSPKLHTAARAAIKQYREEIRKEKEKKQEEYARKMLEEQKREEEREIQKLRQQTNFKAKPIRKYAPLPPVKKRQLTDPVSPNFSKRRRLEPSNSSNGSSSHASSSGKF